MKVTRVRPGLLALMFSTAIVLGCQNTSPVKVRSAKSTTQNRPMVEVRHGSFEFESSVNMAISLRLSDLQQGYKLQAVPTPPPASQIARVKITVSGGGLASPLVQEVLASDFIDGVATVVFSSLPPATYTVKAEAYNSTDVVIFTATSKAIITAGARVELELNCEPTTGSLSVRFRCKECSPLPATPTPSPQPTPTATPTPTPTPVPVDLTPYMSGVATLNADALGNLYLLGSGLGSEASKTSIVQIPPLPNGTATVRSHGVLTSMGDAEFIGGHLFVCQSATGGQPNATTVELDENFNAIAQLSARTYGVVTKDVDGALVSLVGINSSQSVEMILVPPPNPLTSRYSSQLSPIEQPGRVSLQGGPSPAVVWTTASGIMRATGSPAADVLFPYDRLAAGGPLGITGTGMDSSLILFTREGDSKIYSLDGTIPGSVSQARDMAEFYPEGARVFPRDVSIGEDGKFYVAVYSPSAEIMPKRLDWSFHTGGPLKVFRFELDRSGPTPQLVNAVEMARLGF